MKTHRVVPDETKNVKIHRFVSNLNKIVLKNTKLFSMKTKLCKNTPNCFSVENKLSANTQNCSR